MMKKIFFLTLFVPMLKSLNYQDRKNYIANVSLSFTRDDSFLLKVSAGQFKNEYLLKKQVHDMEVLLIDDEDTINTAKDQVQRNYKKIV